MNRMELIERLENKLKKHTIEFEMLVENPQINNIAWGSAGYLSKSSRNKLYKQRDKIGAIADKIQLTKFCLKLLRGESFTLNDLHILSIQFVADIYADYYSVFSEPCFLVCKVKEMIHIIFDRYSLPKQCFVNCKLVYAREDGTKLLIDLKE